MYKYILLYCHSCHFQFDRAQFLCTYRYKHLLNPERKEAYYDELDSKFTRYKCIPGEAIQQAGADVEALWGFLSGMKRSDVTAFPNWPS